MFSIGSMPPSAVNESCAALTAPVEVPVEVVANRAVPGMPKRTSLPSMAAPAAAVALPAVECSARASSTKLTVNSAPMAASTA